MSSMTSLITSFSQSSALFYSPMSGEAVGIGLKGFFSWAVSTVIHITNIAGYLEHTAFSDSAGPLAALWERTQTMF